MITCPKTRAEAEAYRYNEWAGNPGGSAYRLTRCAYEVYPHVLSHGRQCLHKPGKGPDGLYCGQHAKKVK